jgi:hypothetical protein
MKTETEEAWPAVSEKAESTVVDEAPSWAKITASSVTAASAASAASTTSDGWGATPSWSTPAEDTKAAPVAETSPATESIKDVDPWGDAATNPPLPGTSTRKVNTSTIPAGTKMSWAKIVKYVCMHAIIFCQETDILDYPLRNEIGRADLLLRRYCFLH